MSSFSVMVFVGNGFDISILKKYGKTGKTTSYTDFYHYYIDRYPNASENILIQQMEKARDERKKNWSDFEAILADYITSGGVSILSKKDQLYKNLQEIQSAFSKFLNEIANTDIIDEVIENESVEEYGDVTTKGYRSMSMFMGDLSEEQYKNFRFHNELNNHDEIEFNFYNFNYTALLDNYLYLDRDIFDPEPYKSSRNNFVLYTNPNGYEGNLSFSNPYLRLTTKVIHPHGYQNIPKSLLFGIELDREHISPDDWRRRFVKSFWARSKELYDSCFEKTRLFIIFGCSLGSSDRWWWKRIFNQIKKEDGAELIIYKYGRESEEEVKRIFIDGCCLSEADKEFIPMACSNIFVVSYENHGENRPVFLQL